MNMKTKIACALDGLRLAAALVMAHNAMTVMGKGFLVKIHDLLDLVGANSITELAKIGAVPWIDYKLHDTPVTVALRVKALVENGAKVITVHASGGLKMMQAAVAAAGSSAEIWAITVLTSLAPEEIAYIFGKERTKDEIARDLAILAHKAGIRTIVCSAEEVGYLSICPELAGMGFTVPGTRMTGQALGQQVRSGSPKDAVAKGATCLVIASGFTNADDPVEALKAFANDAKEGEATHSN